MPAVIFKKSYSDVNFSARPGWKINVSDSLAKQLAASGVARLADETTATGTTSETPKPLTAKERKAAERAAAKAAAEKPADPVGAGDTPPAE
ncbi:MAG: hypothetical protein QM754_00680 [Tepidisphaeraceae bacterium]